VGSNHQKFQKTKVIQMNEHGHLSHPGLFQLPDSIPYRFYLSEKVS
jgi:hypothetical protein